MCQLQHVEPEKSTLYYWIIVTDGHLNVVANIGGIFRFILKLKSITMHYLYMEHLAEVV